MEPYQINPPTIINRIYLSLLPEIFICFIIILATIILSGLMTSFREIAPTQQQEEY